MVLVFKLTLRELKERKILSLRIKNSQMKTKYPFVLFLKKMLLKSEQMFLY